MIPIHCTFVSAVSSSYLPQVHPDIASSLGNLASLAQRKEDYPKARTLHHSAVGMRRLLFGSNHPSVTSSLNNLGKTMHTSRFFLLRKSPYSPNPLDPLPYSRWPDGRHGRVRPGKDCYEEALKIRKALYTESDVSVAQVLCNIG